MTALAPMLELLVRLGVELDFDVARDVETAGGSVDVVWFDRCLPIAAVAAESLDLRDAPVLPVVAFVTGTAAAFEAADLTLATARLEGTLAPLRILVIVRDSRQSALAPALQSIEGLKKQDADVAMRGRIADGAACRRRHTWPHDRDAAERSRRMGAPAARDPAAFVFGGVAVQPNGRYRLAIAGAID